MTSLALPLDLAPSNEMSYLADRLLEPAPTRDDVLPDRPRIWVVAASTIEATCELLGDARELADHLDALVGVVTTSGGDQLASQLIAQGADQVWQLDAERVGVEARLNAATRILRESQPRVVFVGAAGDDRQLAARLAVRCRAKLFSPALLVRVKDGQCVVTALHADGLRARHVHLHADETAVVALRPGVGQRRPSDPSRVGVTHRFTVAIDAERIKLVRTIPADPASADIQYLPRLVAGGRGLGGPEGFEVLRRFASRIDAGIAASRMAVDLGWVERERQVGQTGKKVAPELYIACAISGASHHLEGMSTSRCIVALNHDPQAPIFRAAHLGLVCDWRSTLEALMRMSG